MAGIPEHCLEGAYFTPLGLARDTRIEVLGNRILDLCAGIGHLSFACRSPLDQHWNGEHPREFVCVERNPAYVRVGRRIMPEATWICADIFAGPTSSLGSFDTAIANPPFGPVRRSGDAPGYHGARFEFHVIATAARLARHGVFLVPQQSAPFSYSGKARYTEDPDAEYLKFYAATGIKLQPSCGIDTTCYNEDWHQSPTATEVVVCDFTGQPSTRVQDNPRSATAGSVRIR